MSTVSCAAERTVLASATNESRDRITRRWQIVFVFFIFIGELIFIFIGEFIGEKAFRKRAPTSILDAVSLVRAARIPNFRPRKFYSDGNGDGLCVSQRVPQRVHQKRKHVNLRAGNFSLATRYSR